MALRRAIEALSRRIWGEERGNFGIMTAFAIPVVLGAAGVAIDLTGIMMRKAELQDASDSAALAAAAAMANDGKSAADAKKIAQQYMNAQLGGTAVTATVDIKETSTSGSGKQFKVDVSATYAFNVTPFTRLLGQTTANVSALSTAESATESKNALSMFLVLDKSGSMAWVTSERDTKQLFCVNYTEANWGTLVLPSYPCYITKLATLKTAVANLFAQLNKADPKSTFVRTAAISYDSVAYTPTALSWGTATALTYVNALTATGGTSSASAMATAYAKLMEVGEVNAHKAKNGQTPSRYIVFMTDGVNDSTSDDTKTRNTCDAAKNDGVEIYTVAFMAPTKGQTLLKYCATGASYYFEADDTDGLIAAFNAIGARTAASVSRLTN